MIKNPDLVVEAEHEFERKHPLTFQEKLQMLEEMYEFALSMNALRESELDDEEDNTVRLAKALHGKI